jgi:hypothetical protein
MYYETAEAIIRRYFDGIIDHEECVAGLNRCMESVTDVLKEADARRLLSSERVHHRIVTQELKRRSTPLQSKRRTRVVAQ